MPTSPLQLLTSLGFPGVARMIRAGRIGRKGAIDQVWHAYKVRDVEREGAVAASDAIRAYFVQKDARVKAKARPSVRKNPNPPGGHFSDTMAHGAILSERAQDRVASDAASAAGYQDGYSGKPRAVYGQAVPAWIENLYSVSYEWGERQKAREKEVWPRKGGHPSGHPDAEDYLGEAYAEGRGTAKASPRKTGGAAKGRDQAAGGDKALPAGVVVSLQPDVYGTILVHKCDRGASIRQRDLRFRVTFGKYDHGYVEPDPKKKPWTYPTLAAARQAAIQYVEQGSAPRNNPTTGSKKTAAAFGKAVLSAVKALVKGAAVTLSSATGSLWGRGGWDAAYSAAVTVEPVQGAPFSVQVSAKTAAATENLPAQTAGTVMVDGAIGSSQRRPDADVLTWAKKAVSEARPVIQAHAGTYRGNPAGDKPKKPRKVKARTAYQAQAYHFDAASWDRPRVIQWLNRYGHSSANVKLVGDEYVAPQFESWDYETSTLHRVQVAKHVEAMVGVPLAGSDGANASGYNKRFGQVGLFPKGKRAPKKAAPVTDGIDWTSDDSPF